ncbi:MAG TPA: pilus assembly protein TadG-related protein [Telluria sp.]
MHSHAGISHRQGGAFVVTLALILFLLVGFMGIALDLGHLFVIRTELQTAMDACALAGAQELDGEPDALTRATNAGITAGNANGVNMQSATWSGQPMISAADISFRDKNQSTTNTASLARYMSCGHTQAGTRTPQLRMLGVALNASTFTATMNVAAYAEATTAPAQSACPVPLALTPKSGSAGPDYGFAKGDWVTLLSKNGGTSPGEIGWANLNGSTSASETANELNGYCGTKVGSQLGTPGVQSSVGDVWNARFGIYKNNDGPSANNPDYTGYVYTSVKSGTWTQGNNAYPDFVLKRQAFAACAASVKDCTNATGLSLNSYKTIASPGSGGDFQTYGRNRRLVVVPVVNAGNQVIDFVCMLMLQPIPSPFDDVQLEYRGNASDPASPCTTNGLPGGAAGPLVPVLVR